MHMTAVLTLAEEGCFNSYNPETGTGSQGDTMEEALANLRDAVELYLEEFRMRTLGSPVVTSFDVPVHA